MSLKKRLKKTWKYHNYFKVGCKAVYLIDYTKLKNNRRKRDKCWSYRNALDECNRRLHKMQDFVLDSAITITATVMAALIKRSKDAAIEAANLTKSRKRELQKKADAWNVHYKIVKSTYATIKNYGKRI